MKRPNGFPPPPPPEPEAPSAPTPPKSVRPIRAPKASAATAAAGSADRDTPAEERTPTSATTGRFTIGGVLPGIRTEPIAPEPSNETTSKGAPTKAATSKAATSKAAPTKAATSKAATSKAATSKAATSKAVSPKASVPTPSRPTATPAAASYAPASPSRSRSDESLARKNVRATERERRRYERAEARRFTERSRRRRLFWLVSAGIVVALVLLVVFTAYSPLFAVRTVDIEGTSRIDAAQVEFALSDQVGKPLALVDYGAINRDLATFTLIQSYAIESELPNTLVIRIVERQPVGSVPSGTGFDLVDAAGVVIEHSDQRPTGYPQIDTTVAAVGSPGFLAATAVLRALPADLLAKVGTVSAATPDSVTLVLTDAGQKVIWGSVDNSALKAVVLDKLIAAQGDNSTYDVSSPDTPIVS
ncbi:FtsQ-type POTRA domain-containing protein [Subtercola endophyticus]|uniref:FtsQ-type POTRA domain-containing protein n=1 Tax=Subtercola endophyticus TaxID=2895559 RepID=UPI001E4081ED|nr:FtsQ-type POTRA domain-containing protein [Subtercola endophyticus]UFS60471.1 FtsQ-type POTRA domain-containing protein [Subtercola endophyticus]